MTCTRRKSGITSFRWKVVGVFCQNSWLKLCISTFCLDDHLNSVRHNLNKVIVLVWIGGYPCFPHRVLWFLCWLWLDLKYNFFQNKSEISYRIGNWTEWMLLHLKNVIFRKKIFQCPGPMARGIVIYNYSIPIRKLMFYSRDLEIF